MRSLYNLIMDWADGLLHTLSCGFTKLAIATLPAIPACLPRPPNPLSSSQELQAGLEVSYVASPHPDFVLVILFIAVQLAEALVIDPNSPDLHLILADVVEPKAPAGAHVITLKTDLTHSANVESLFETAYGIPDVVYAMHGIMSRGSEDSFDLGLKVASVLRTPPSLGHTQ